MRLVRACRCLALAALLAGAAASELSAQEPMLPPALADALAGYVELKTFSMKWTERFQLGEAAPDKIGPADVVYLVWQKGKIYRLRTRESRAGKQRRDEFAFDGRILAGGSSDRAPGAKPALMIDLAESKDPESEYFGVKYLQPLGIHVPPSTGELLRAKSLASEFLFLLEQGGRLKAVGEETVDGVGMTRAAIVADNPRWRSLQKLDLTALEKLLRAGSKTQKEATIQKRLATVKRAKEVEPRQLEHVVYFDPSHGYAVRRWQQFTEDGRLRVQSECTEPDRLPGSKIWMPRKCRTADYASADSPGEVFKSPFHTRFIEVSEFGTTPVPEELFTLKYTVPGSRITDHTLPEAKPGKGGVTYTVPANPEDVGRAIEQAQTKARERAESGGWLSTLKGSFTVGLIVLAIAGIVCLVLRYRAKKAA